MKRINFPVMYLLLLLLQLFISNYLRLSYYVTLSILPVMILLLPIKIKTVPSLLIAFATGLIIDILSDGLVGLNVVALLPVAILRRPVISLVFGSEFFAREENITTHRQGLWKMSVAIFLVQTVFLLCYIWSDGAGTRPLLFNGIHCGASLLAGFCVSLIIAEAISSEFDSRR